MKISDTSKQLLEAIAPQFEGHGFKLNKKAREFSRKVNNCRQIFDLYFYKERSHITIKPEIRIKVKEIEDIYRSVTKIDGRPFRTIGNHLFEILKYIDDGVEIVVEYNIYDWVVKDQMSLNKLIEVVPGYFEETILPYFEENSSVSRVDEILNKYPRELSIHNYLYPLRANIAIIAAKLNKNPRYDELVVIYEEELQEAEETYKEDFWGLKSLLSSDRL